LAQKNFHEGMSIPQQALLGRYFREAIRELANGTNGAFSVLDGPSLATAIEQYVMRRFLASHGVKSIL
jgi:hypothetical protein